VSPCELAAPSFPSRSISRLYISMRHAVPYVNTAAGNQDGGLLLPTSTYGRNSIAKRARRTHTVLTVGCMLPPKLSSIFTEPTHPRSPGHGQQH
jgi:hypothetical protein